LRTDAISRLRARLETGPGGRRIAEEADVSRGAFCSFCRKPPGEVGPLVEGPDTGSGSVFICRACAALTIDIIDDEGRRRRGEKPALMAKLTGELIEIYTKALDRFEALSKQRELTETELEHQQKVEAELERLRSEA
jgi:hypothetical protein